MYDTFYCIDKVCVIAKIITVYANVNEYSICYIIITHVLILYINIKYLVFQLLLTLGFVS